MEKKEMINVENLHRLIGKTVFLIYEDYIIRQTIGYVGSTSFIILGFAEDVKFNFLEWEYVDFGKNWTFDFAEAKELLQDKFPEKRIIEIQDGYWEAV